MDTSVLVIGETLVDIVKCNEHDTPDEIPGGSPANVAVGLGRMGRHVRLATWLANDPHGKLCKNHVEMSNVKLTETSMNAPYTTTARATLNAIGAATYTFNVNWALPPVTITPTDGYIVTGSLAAVIEPGATSVYEAIMAGRDQALVVYDPNPRPLLFDPYDQRLHADGAAGDAAGGTADDTGDDADAAAEDAAAGGTAADADDAADDDAPTMPSRDRINDIIAVADIIKASDEDLKWLIGGGAGAGAGAGEAGAGEGQGDGVAAGAAGAGAAGAGAGEAGAGEGQGEGVDDLESIEKIARTWLAGNASLIVITRAGNGMDAFYGNGDNVKHVHVDCFPSVVVDTVGAGDTVTAGIIDGLIARGIAGARSRRALSGLEENTVRGVLQHAARMAAHTVSHQGADLPWKADIMDK